MHGPFILKLKSRFECINEKVYFKVVNPSIMHILFHLSSMDNKPLQQQKKCKRSRCRKQYFWCRQCLHLWRVQSVGLEVSAARPHCSGLWSSVWVWVWSVSGERLHWRDFVAGTDQTPWDKHRPGCTSSTGLWSRNIKEPQWKHEESTQKNNSLSNWALLWRTFYKEQYLVDEIFHSISISITFQFQQH